MEIFSVFGENEGFFFSVGLVDYVSFLVDGLERGGSLFLYLNRRGSYGREGGGSRGRCYYIIFFF